MFSPSMPFAQHLRSKVLAAVILASVAASPALALTDPIGDFLPTYTGVQAGDLDVVQALGLFDAARQTFTFEATLAAPIGTTPGALYVWGLDRGQGTERFVNGTPSIGQGVLFDSVLVVRPDGTGQFNDIVNNTQVALSAGSIVIVGNAIVAKDLPASLFPSTGRAFGDYTWNLWPRVGLGSNTQISDFAPDGHNASLYITSVPEPGSLPLLMSSLVVLGWCSVRRT